MSFLPPQAVTSTVDLQQFFGNQTPPRDHFVSVLQHWAERRPDAIAYIFTDVESVEQKLTYAELWNEVRALAGYLQGRCRVRSGDRVLLLYPPGLDFVIGFFACHAAGAIAVPAYPPRRNRKASRIRSIVVDADARWALSTRSVVEQLTGDQRHDDLIGVQLLGTDDPRCRDASKWRRPKLKSNSLAVLQYTSGSTGSPKGVMLNHANLIANSELILHAFEPSGNICGMTWLPTYHDMGLVGGVLMPMFIGQDERADESDDVLAASGALAAGDLEVQGHDQRRTEFLPTNCVSTKFRMRSWRALICRRGASPSTVPNRFARRPWMRLPSVSSRLDSGDPLSCPVTAWRKRR